MEDMEGGYLIDGFITQMSPTTIGDPEWFCTSESSYGVYFGFVSRLLLSSLYIYIYTKY